MKTLNYEGEIFQAQRIVKGDNFIIGYDEDNLLLFAFRGIVNFMLFSLNEGEDWDLPDEPPEQPKIINDLVTGGTTDALSAEQGKVLNNKFRELYKGETSIYIDPLNGNDDSNGDINNPRKELSKVITELNDKHLVNAVTIYIVNDSPILATSTIKNLSGAKLTIGVPSGSTHTANFTSAVRFSGCSNTIAISNSSMITMGVVNCSYVIATQCTVNPTSMFGFHCSDGSVVQLDNCNVLGSPTYCYYAINHAYVSCVACNATDLVLPNSTTAYIASRAYIRVGYNYISRANVLSTNRLGGKVEIV